MINRYMGTLFATVLLSDRSVDNGIPVLPPSRFQGPGSTHQLEARRLHPAVSLHF